MLEQNKKYTYEELKEIFDKIQMKVMINPFGDLEDKVDEKLNPEARFTTMLLTMPLMHTMKECLFGKEEK